MPTHTYFIEEDGGVAIKIGATCRDPEWRRQSLQIGNPRRLTLLATVADPMLERELHARFSEYRISGEWYHADAPGLRELIAEISDPVVIAA